MRVYETANCFMIERKGESKCLGDGVDQVFRFRGKEVRVGEPSFVKA